MIFLVVIVYDPPRVSVYDIIRDFFLGCKASREYINLDQRIRERGMILDESVIARTKSVCVFCARLDIASGRNPAEIPSDFFVGRLAEFCLASELPDVELF